MLRQSNERERHRSNEAKKTNEENKGFPIASASRRFLEAKETSTANLSRLVRGERLKPSCSIVKFRFFGSNRRELLDVGDTVFLEDALQLGTLEGIEVKVDRLGGE